MEIFYLYRKEHFYPAWWWKNLTDVCRRWREIIFTSPRFLDLELKCTEKTPTRTSLDIWPPFPITIDCYCSELDDRGQDNIIAALKHHDRVVKIHITGLRLRTYLAVTQKPFPVLKKLHLASYDDMAPVLDEEFLGKSAPCLQSLSLWKVAFPTFPKFALFCSSLSSLNFWRIPIAGYISPEAMATCLATLPSLRSLSIEFESPQSRPDRIGLPPPTRAVLPSLRHFQFTGVSEYLEDLVARIDTPKLRWLIIHLFMDLMFNIPQHPKFIVRAESIRLPNSAEIGFSSFTSGIILGHVNLEVICREPDRQASSMAQVCSQLSPLLSHVERLHIRDYMPGQEREGNGIDPTLFLELFHPFPATQYLHIYDGLKPLVARALKELTEETAIEVLPSLHRLVFRDPSPSGSIRNDIQGFITARQNLNHPVDVEWETI